MSFEAVELFVFDTNIMGGALSAVTVKVYGPDGRTVFGQAVTDENGQASFLLPSGKYQLRFYKFAVNFKNPRYIDVVAGGLNSFNAYGVKQVHPQSVDHRLCVASGYFRGPSGEPLPNIVIGFVPQFDPLLIDGAGVLHERVVTRTDSSGFAQITLIRFAKYDVSLEGTENIYRDVAVPDAAAVNLPDLLFPGIKGVSYNAPVPVPLLVGEYLDLPVALLTTDLRELAELGRDVQWSVSNPDVLSFEILPGVLRLRGLRPGSSLIQGQRRDTTIRIPDRPIEGLPIPVLVS